MNVGVILFNIDFKDKIIEVCCCIDIIGNVFGQCMINGNSYKFISDCINVDKVVMCGVEVIYGWDINKDWLLIFNYIFI